MRPFLVIFAVGVFAFPIDTASADSAPAGLEANLASYASGAWIAKRPREFDESWSAYWLLDERSDSGWATPKGLVAGPHEVVIEFAQKSLIRSVEFDTASVDGDSQGSRAAADITVDISDESAEGGFRSVAAVRLEPRKDRQRFAIASPIAGRWIRLTVKSNHGSTEYIELFEFRAFGEALGQPAPVPSFTGAYRTNFSTFRMVQQGSTLTGCYEYKHGLVENGGIEGRVARFTWAQDSSGGPLPRGPAFFVFSPDAKQFIGLWWYETLTNKRGEIWRGTRTGDKPGACAHWRGPAGASKQLAAQLGRGEKARIYGIRFDLDSDTLRDDSTPALDSIAKLARENPSWRFVIEGHTDATGTPEHNQALSERRAAAVKAWLVKAGIVAARLDPVGFGATKPVAGNDTGMGRAQNRRVELARR
ncbi:MAG: OmpA family protein [Betaproteobacteria bacterium]|nr:OmpA family protein [Betaproteobacteria bacterium]